MKKPPLKMTVDYVFKQIFGDERNIGILRAFLKAALDLPDAEYDTLTLADPHLKREFRDDKSGVLDIKVRTKSGYIIHVEIQVLTAGGLRERFTYYAARLLAEQLRRGGQYRLLERVISIIIMDGILVPEEEGYYNKYALLNRETGKAFTNLLEITVLELPKLPMADDGSGIWKWAKLLKSRTEEEYMEAAARDADIGKTVVKVMELSEDERERMLADSREMFLWDCWIREHENYEAGAAEERLEIAGNLRGLGVPADKIARATGLSLGEIEKL
ncbi:MAG: Rpn family recombination-promoting nuclease/putative transposase [Treponema sp.]|jgi:predicted transposase/invertase (TIGR01784 family)|nr:Rpn family recombination-promoting nuclease/putative transposase [Treponema sp.]